MKLFKNLFSRRNRGHDALTNDPPIRPISSSPTPTSEDASPRPHILDAPRNTQHDDPDSFPLEPGNKRNGKIAKLPRHLRDHINRALDSGQSAVSIAEHLNKLPEVKTILDTHFEGRPIRHQNLSEWKAGGYRDWQLRQELLFKQQELAADASEMAKIAHGMDDSLFGMALLDYAHLMKNVDKDTPEEFEKKRKALSNMINDIVRLRRCQNQTRGVEVQEERLERDREKTAEEMFQKFMEWASNPEIRRTFILEPIVAMALQRRHFGLPPRPEDAAVLKEYGSADPAETGKNQEVPADFPPPPTKNSEVENPAYASSEPEQVQRLATAECAPSSPSPTSEDASPHPSTLDATRNTQHVGPVSPIVSAPSPTSEDNSPHPQILDAPRTTQLAPPATESDLDDGLSQVYAALRPAPHILEERNRKHEELRRQAEANRQIRLIQSAFSQRPASEDDSPRPHILDALRNTQHDDPATTLQSLKT